VNWAGFGETFLFVNYLGAGPLTWLGYGAMTYFGRTKMRLLDKERPAPANPPHVTILIPAKDEGPRIRSCLESAINQDYAYVDVIAIDDRSKDDTGKIMDEMAAANPRLSVIHIQEGTLGPGWTGKNNALFTGAKQAKGDWLLFVDSDVTLQPNAVTKTITVSNYKKYDLLSLLPKCESHTIWESSLVPLCSAAAATMYLIALSNDDSKPITFANGQFLLMRRTAYDAIGGHETVKDRFCEDTEIARLVKGKGLRTRVSWGEDIAAVRMYTSLPGIIKGWSRIYYAAKVGNPKHILGAMNFVLTSCFSAYAAIIYGIVRYQNPHGNMLDNAWLGAGLLHLALLTFFLSNIYHWSRNPRWNALLFPITGPILLWTLIKGLILCITKKVEWRGTSYSHTMEQNLAVKS
jgi:cellulose synthase/poly-beta-1,6-N-acetylglucosamine synthase-like glycosyltransferase